MKKKLLCTMLSILMIFSLCGCDMNKKTSSAETEENVITIARNDWYGAVQRISELQRNAKDVVNILDGYNYDIIVGNPNDYWSDNYFFLEFNPVDSKYMPCTIYLNEEQDWPSIQANTINALTAAGFDTSKASVTKTSANHYTISWEDWLPHPTTLVNTTTNIELQILYDATHNWAQLAELTYVFNEKIPYQESLYEFAELEKGKYAIQTETDRLYCEYDDKGNLATMYYSVLGKNEDGSSDTEEEYDGDYVAEIIIGGADVEEEKPYGQLPQFYNIEDDSIFTHIKDINRNWVLEKPAVEQYVIYEDEVLSFKVKNKLSGELEGFAVAKRIPVPVYNEETGTYINPETGEPTTMEEYNAKVEALQTKIDEIENEPQRKEALKNLPTESRYAKYSMTDPDYDIEEYQNGKKYFFKISSEEIGAIDLFFDGKYAYLNQYISKEDLDWMREELMVSINETTPEKKFTDICPIPESGKYKWTDVSEKLDDLYDADMFDSQEYWLLKAGRFSIKAKTKEAEFSELTQETSSLDLLLSDEYIEKMTYDGKNNRLYNDELTVDFNENKVSHIYGIYTEENEFNTEPLTYEIDILFENIPEMEIANNEYELVDTEDFMLDAIFGILGVVVQDNETEDANIFGDINALDVNE